MIKKFFRKYWRVGVILIFGAVAISTTIKAAPSYFILPPGQPGCDEPIQWKIGKIDERFPISKTRFLATTFKAQRLWEKALNKNLFIYNQKSDFEIQTEYDERQEKTYEGQTLNEKLEGYEEDRVPLEQQYNALQVQYDNLMKEYNTLASEYEDDVKEYEEDIEKWNKKGGAPPDAYDDLKDNRDDLEKTRNELNNLNAQLNTLADKINAIAYKINNQTEKINEEIETFNEKYGDPQPFIQGHYTTPLDNITIFQFQAEDDLLLVLMHELGHSLGIMEHVKDPQAIMHYLMNQQDINNPQITQGDINAYNSICTPRELSRKDQLISYFIHTPWKEMDLLKISNMLFK